MFETLVSTLEHMQDAYGTGPGVRRSKRPVWASRTRYIFSIETFRYEVITSNGDKFTLGNKVTI